jgi:hypothetical protein
MQRIIPKIGDKYKNYTIISNSYLLNKIWYVDVKCQCGKIKKQPTGNLKKLNQCKKCNAIAKYRKYKSGDKKFNLTIIDYIDNSSNTHTKIKVRCDCGNINNISSYHFGKIKMCKKCFLSKRGKDHASYKGTKHITKTYFSQIKLNAKKRNLKFKLSINDLDNLLEKQNFSCYLSGQKITVHNKTASLDRIDSSQGYIIDNVAWIHKDIQRMKSNFTVDYFINICNKISKNNIYTSQQYPQ